MISLLTRLHDAFIKDEDLDDDLDVVLGATAGPTGLSGSVRRRPLRPRPLRRIVALIRQRTDKAVSDELTEVLSRAEYLTRMLRQLVNIAHHRAGGAPSSGLTQVLTRADHLLRVEQAKEFVAARAHLRRLALAALDLLELLTPEDTEPAPTFDASSASGGWSA